MTPRRLSLLAAVVLLAGCAALPPGKRDPRDPFERVNRSVYRFNTAADEAVLRPVALGWRAVVPLPLRTALGNFLGNLGYTTTIINDMLQGRLSDSGIAVARLGVNTVLGLGFFDPASHMKLPRQDQDFAKTLARWGVPPGAYLMLPIFGPSSVRDAPALLVNDYTGVRHYLNDNVLRWGLGAIGTIELRTQLLSTDGVVRSSYDPYALTRNAWLQRREFMQRDFSQRAAPGGADAPTDDNSPPLEEPPDDPLGTPPAPGAVAAPANQAPNAPAPPPKP
jgi:phospholipid-binding lipoprotein MlaA